MAQKRIRIDQMSFDFMEGMMLMDEFMNFLDRHDAFKDFLFEMDHWDTSLYEQFVEQDVKMWIIPPGEYWNHELYVRNWEELLPEWEKIAKNCLTQIAKNRYIEHENKRKE